VDILKSERTRLQALSTKELEGNYPAWLNDSEVCKFNRHGDQHVSFERVKEFVEGLKRDPSRIVCACYCEADDVHIGNLSLQTIDGHSGTAEIAFLFGETAYWGKGYAQEAAHRLMAYGFAELNLHRIYCAAASENRAMRRLAEKLGFKEEGVRRGALMLNNQRMDAHEFGILASEFL
jgi:[ribosomal protein S5]-alanine N-acetyltransferase